MNDIGELEQCLRDNEFKLTIKVFYIEENVLFAREICYGIEEEGLLFELIKCKAPSEQALENVAKTGLGVAVSSMNNRVELYCRQFKEKAAFIICDNPSKVMLRIFGKNSARIIKQSPLIIEGV